MKHLITAMSGRLTETWARRREFARRLREDDRGSVTVENVLWTLVWAGLATTVGAVIYKVVLAKAQSFHL